MTGLVTFTKYDDTEVTLNIARIVKMEQDNHFPDKRTVIYLSTDSAELHSVLVNGDVDDLRSYIKAWRWS